MAYSVETLQEPMETTVAVVGGGPAGATATIWLHQFGIPTILLEARNKLGGIQLFNPYLDTWMLGVQGKTGQEIAKAQHEHVLTLGCKVLLNSAVTEFIEDEQSFYLRLQDGGMVCCRYVIVAAGTTSRTGGLKESTAIRIGPGATMEQIAVAGKRVAILGGGDNAFDQAMFASKRGAREVRIFARRPPRAQRILQALIPTEWVQVGPFIVDQKKMTVSRELFDVISVQFGFEAIEIPGLSLERSGGYITVNQQGRTSVPRVFACGDITNFFHPCVTTACAHGVQVAKAIALELAAEV